MAEGQSSASTGNGQSVADRVKRHRKRVAALRTERSTWDAHYRDIRDFILPRSARFLNEQENRGDQNEWANIINSRATKAGNTLAAGLMSGMTSPARPWFRLAVQDADLMEYAPVKMWLDKQTRDMRNIFARSNTYRALHAMYRDLGHYGTAVSTFEDNFENGIHLTPLLTGQYHIATDAMGNVRTLYREFKMTVEQVVTAFGIENVSGTVKRMWENADLDKWVDITHALEPRSNYQAGKIDTGNMQFSSCYFETKSNESKYLRDSGMKRFRALGARWDVYGNDAYGVGPGSEAVGYVKQLQQEVLRKAQAIDLMTDPPTQGPALLKGHGIDKNPGGHTPVSGPNGQKIESLYDIRLDLSHLRDDIMGVERAIDGVYFADLFLMLANDDRSGTTAREIVERHEEKMLVLGPVLERLHNELLDPLVELTWDRMNRARGSDGRPMVEPPPKELQGNPINVEFVSTLAQAQKAIGIGNVEKWAGMIAGVAPLKPEILDKFNEDEFADITADMLGIDVRLVRANDDAAKIRAGRAKQAQAQQMAAAAKPAADAAQAAATVAGMPQENQQALSDVLSAYTGYSGAG